MLSRMKSISIDAAGPADQDLLFRLLQLYYFEATRWSGEDVGASGLYACDPAGVRSYLVPECPDRAYLFRYDGQVCGFALVEQVDIDGTTMRELADLFVLPKYRGRGVADAAIRSIVLRSEGAWLIAMFKQDLDAQRYWTSAFRRLPFTSVRRAADDALFQRHIVNERLQPR